MILKKLSVNEIEMENMNKQNVINIASDLIKKFESCRLQAYSDDAGIQTIGWGSTQVQADFWLTQRIEEDYNRLDIFWHVHGITLDDNQAAAILSFTYNAGFEAFVSSSISRDLIQKRVEKVTADLMKWNKMRVDNKLVFSQGLYNRRMEESQCFVNKGEC
jgi:lysozyme